MRQVNDLVLSAPNTSATLITGPALDTNQMINMSFQAVLGDSTAAGTFAIQVSNDIYQVGQPVGNFTPTNWTTLSGGISMTAGMLTSIISLTEVSYRWVRPIFTITTPGTSTIKVQRFGMGA